MLLVYLQVQCKYTRWMASSKTT